MKGLNFKNFRTRERFSGWSQSAFSDRYFWLFFFLWLLPSLVSVLYIFFNFGSLPQEIPLFYSRLWGQTQLAKSSFIYLPIFGVVLLGIFNFGLAINFHFRDKIFSYLFAGASTIIAILCAITTVNIVYLMS